MWHSDYMATRAKAHPDINRAELAREIGMDRTLLTKILNGKRPMSLPVALSIFELKGLRLGPISNASPNDIRAMRRALAAAQ